MNGLQDKVVVITGANSGIGKEAAVALSAMGATTVLACRNADKAAAAAREVKERAANDSVAVVALDLADLASVHAAAATIVERWGRVDILVNNAGGVWSKRQTTAQGFEQTFGVNHLGHFYLTSLLLDTLVASAPARIINVSSAAHRLAVRGMRWSDLQHERHYLGMEVYGESKLANILFTRGLARRYDPACGLQGRPGPACGLPGRPGRAGGLPGRPGPAGGLQGRPGPAGGLQGRPGPKAVTANAVHPGPVRSGFGMDGDARGLLGIGNRLIRPFEVTPLAGADTIIFLAIDDVGGEHSGGYWSNRSEATMSRAALDDESVERLWTESEKLLADAGYPSRA